MVTVTGWGVDLNDALLTNDINDRLAWSEFLRTWSCAALAMTVVSDFEAASVHKRFAIEFDAVTWMSQEFSKWLVNGL